MASCLLLVLMACGRSSPATTPAAEPDTRALPNRTAAALSAGDSHGSRPLARGNARQSQGTDWDFAPGGPISDAELGRFYVVIGASVGGRALDEMAFAMWPDRAPITVRNFLRLAHSGFYDGLTFHRVLRDFMIQGGCARGDGLGESPLGTIEAEFSHEPERRHRYGVLSMARIGGQPNSAGSQFFLINDEGASSMSLDGEYASFGRMTQGVASLEALSNTAVRQNPVSGEPSQPVERLVMDYVRVVEGDAPSGEVIERPEVIPDLNGEPSRVQVETLTIGFTGSRARAARSESEAEQLAQSLLTRLNEGEGFVELAAEYSDDRQQVALKEIAGIYRRRLLNRGVRDRESERLQLVIQRDGQAQAKSLQAQQIDGTITKEDFQKGIQALQREMQGRLLQEIWLTPSQVGPAYDAYARAFQMQVGEVELVPYDRNTNPNGWILLHRVE